MGHVFLGGRRGGFWTMRRKVVEMDLLRLLAQGCSIGCA